MAKTPEELILPIECQNEMIYAHRTLIASVSNLYSSIKDEYGTVERIKVPDFTSDQLLSFLELLDKNITPTHLGTNTQTIMKLMDYFDLKERKYLIDRLCEYDPVLKSIIVFPPFYMNEYLSWKINDERHEQWQQDKEIHDAQDYYNNSFNLLRALARAKLIQK